MKIFNRKKTIEQEMAYATAADFCRIFAKDMNRLYLLSLLLTGNQSMAENVFVSGLDDSTKRNTVFKEWAQSWARRKIIQNAIEMIRPQPTNGNALIKTEDRSSIPASNQPAEIAAIIALPAFERFVFVMSVLEGYAVHECSILLGCSRGDIVGARSRALQQIGSGALQRGISSVSSDDQLLEVNHQSKQHLGRISPIAVSA